MKQAGMLFAAYLVTVACLWTAASQTGIASGEDVHLTAARAVGTFFDQVGVGDTSLFDQPARDKAWSPVHQNVVAPTLLSALIWHVASSGYEWWGELLSLRLGFVFFSALSIPLLLSLMLPLRGPRAAWLAAAFLSFVPRAMHQAVVADPRSMTVTGWLLILVCYMRARHALTTRRAVMWTVLGGVALGVATASSHGALVVLVVPIAHTFWLERSRLRAMVRKGLLPLPASVGVMLIPAPAVFWLLTPWLWHDAAKRVRSLFVNAFSSDPETANTSTSAMLSLVASVPAVTLCAACLGLAIVLGPARVRAWGWGKSGTDRTEGSLLVVALVVALVWPWVAPASMHATPPRWLVALPFVAGLAGIGLDAAMREIPAQLRSCPTWLRVGAVSGALALTLGVALGQTCRQPATRSAAFTTLSGGPAWVASHPGPLPLHDGSPVSVLAPAIDALGHTSLSVFSPSISPDVWQGMQRFGCLRARVRVARSPIKADMLILGPMDGPMLEQAASRGSTRPS